MYGGSGGRQSEAGRASARGRLAVAGALAAGAVSLALAAALTARGLGDPTAATPGSLSHTTVVFDAAVLVLREGLEAILVLAAITASFKGANATLRRPVAGGAGLALLATVAAWFAAVSILDTVDAPELDVQASTGLVAVLGTLAGALWFVVECRRVTRIDEQWHVADADSPPRQHAAS